MGSAAGALGRCRGLTLCFLSSEKNNEKRGPFLRGRSRPQEKQKRQGPSPSRTLPAEVWCPQGRGPELMVLRGPKNQPCLSLPSGLRGQRAHHPPPGAPGLPAAVLPSPARCERHRRSPLRRGSVTDPPPGLNSSFATRSQAGGTYVRACVRVCVCACGQGDRKGAQDTGAGEGFLPFCIFVSREQRNFYGYFLRMVCSRHPGRLAHPFLASLGYQRAAETAPGSPRGFASTAPSPPQGRQ